MCCGCWQEYGSPTVVSPRVVRAVALIRKLYETEPAGGMLHVQLDDNNIEDAHFTDPFDDYLTELYGRGPLPVEREIVRVMRRMSIEERASALGIHDGCFDAPSVR